MEVQGAEAKAEKSEKQRQQTQRRVRGDEVFACVVAGELGGAEKTAFAERIVRWCLGELAYYKAPGYVAFVEALPLTSTQKIQRGELKSLAHQLLKDGACIDTRHLKRRDVP